MHAVLGDFVDAAQWRLLIEAEEMIERAGAFAHRVALLDRFCHVCLCENGGFTELLSEGELRSDRG